MTGTGRDSIASRMGAALRIPDLAGGPSSLFEIRRVGPVPGWLQIVAVVGLFVATVFLTNSEYRAKGSVFGFAGPGFNALISPIYEELVFRGWILGRLTRWKAPAVGIAVSSLLFGILHLRNIFWLETGALVTSVLMTGCVLGPVLGYVALRCRSVWPAVIAHYLNNLVYYLRH